MGFSSANKLLISLLLSLSFTLLAFGKAEHARMMVHLLDYIAVDYSMAVQNGKVVSAAEYQEMNEFAQTIIELGEKTPASIQSDLILLQKLVADKATIDKVSSVSNGIKQKIISHYQLEIAPKRWPSLHNGQKLFALHCQSCHGSQGKGDGPLATGLEPLPTNFHDADKANGLSPFQAYNTIRLGVENTGMRAFNELNDDEVWDLAFYVMSLPHQGQNVDPALVKNDISGALNLEMLASLDNRELQQQLQIDPARPSTISALRLFPKELAQDKEGNYLDKAKRLIISSAEAYAAGNREEARTLALTAYLEGVEPVEVQLRANDASFVAQLEHELAQMRSAIEGDEEARVVQELAQSNISLLDKAQLILSERSFSGWLSFLLSSSIILREGLEAFLVIITILGIIRALKLPNAATWVHIGWVSAILSGILLWLAADRFFTFSGAQREIMEGAIALFAVGVLLYVGFWMHSKSKAGKWQAYVKNRIQALARKENMFGLALLSFLVVFREAFESVLFLSALNLEIGESHRLAFGGGIVFAFAALAVISVLLLKYSKKIPITKLFKYSSIIISFLAVVLVGKGIHAIQEAGTISISTMPFNLRLDWIGLYPTWETFLAQVGILLLIILLWNIGNRSSVKRTAPVQHQAG